MKIHLQDIFLWCEVFTFDVVSVTTLGNRTWRNKCRQTSSQFVKFILELSFEIRLFEVCTWTTRLSLRLSHNRAIFELLPKNHNNRQSFLKCVELERKKRRYQPNININTALSFHSSYGLVERVYFSSVFFSFNI